MLGIIITIVFLGYSAYDIASYLLRSRTGVRLSGEIIEIKDVSDANISATKVRVAFEYKGKEKEGVVRIPSSNSYLIGSYTAYNRIDIIYIPQTGKVYAARVPEDVERDHILWNGMLTAVVVILYILYS